MTPLHRRTALQLTAAAAWAGLGASSPACAATASDAGRSDAFRRGGMKGFVLGGVQREPAYLTAMVETGANLARVFFPFKRCQNCTQFGHSPEDTQALHRLLDHAQASGLKLVVVGSFQDIEEPAFWSNAALRASFVEQWQWFARTYGQHPALAGMDLMNEPNPPAPHNDAAIARAAWNPLAEQAIAAIRHEGSACPIVFEPTVVQGLRGMQPLRDTNVVYSIHFYAPHDITHQGVSDRWSRRIPYPAGPEWGLGKWEPSIGVTRWDIARLERGMHSIREFQLAHNAPIYVGEFSCIRAAPQGSSSRWVADCLTLFTRFGWSWTYHEFRGWPGWDAEIDSEDLNATQRTRTAPTMRLLRQAMQPPATPRPSSQPHRELP